MQTGLICFELIAKINQINVDLRAVTREYGLTEAEITKEELVRIVKNYEFKAKIKSFTPDTIAQISEKYPLPAIAQKQDGSFFAILKINADHKKILISSQHAHHVSKEYA